MTRLRHLKSPASPITPIPQPRIRFRRATWPARSGTTVIGWAAVEIEKLLSASVVRICHLAYTAIRRREGTDPWSVGTTSARPSGPHARSRTAPFFAVALARPLILPGRSPSFSAVRAWQTHIVLAERRLAEHRTSLPPPSLAQSSFCRPPARCAWRKNLRPVPMHSRLERAAIAGRPRRSDLVYADRPP